MVLTLTVQNAAPAAPADADTWRRFRDRST
jgi:hypothetical protein